MTDKQDFIEPRLTASEALNGSFVSMETNATFSEAVLTLHDGSRLCFAHSTKQRMAKAIGPEGREADTGMAERLKNEIKQFRLNAKHIDIDFNDESRWEHKP